MSDPMIRITEEAQQAYIEACQGSGWGKKEIASKALIIGFEVIKKMDEYTDIYQEECEKAAQQDVLNDLIEKHSQENEDA